MTRSLTTGPDAQWAAARDGTKVVLLDLQRGGAPAVGQLELPSEDCDLALVGPPNVLAVVTREPPRVTIFEPPYLEAVAHLDLDVPARLAALAGPRLVLVSADGTHVTIVRTQGHALSVQKIDPGTPVEFAVGLERNQVLLALLKKLEVWDAVSGRPLLRPQLAAAATAAHRRSGAGPSVGDAREQRRAVRLPALGWPAVPSLRRLADRGRRQPSGVAGDRARDGARARAPQLLRAQPLARRSGRLEAHRWTPETPLALLVAGEDVSLIGMPDRWRRALARRPRRQRRAGARPEPEREPAQSPVVTAADKLRAMRAAVVEPAAASEPRAATETRSQGARGWRESLAAYGAELARGVDSELPVVAVDTELGELAQRLAVSAAARRALTALYALYLVGEPALAIARLARALGDWTEALGQGDLAALALVDRSGGKLALRRAVTERLDGAAPTRDPASPAVLRPTPRAGAFRVSRDGRTDAAIEVELATQLGRIAIIEGDLAAACSRRASTARPRSRSHHRASSRGRGRAVPGSCSCSTARSPRGSPTCRRWRSPIRAS